MKINTLIRYTTSILCVCLFGFSINAQHTETNKFKQLYEELPTPNVYRNASGAPGHQYWQQKADYQMSIRIDNKTQRIYGQETITYTNNSPDALSYLWLQLDQNRRATTSDTYKIGQQKMKKKISLAYDRQITPTFDGGFKIEHITTTKGQSLNYTIVKTMMRIDMPQVLNPGQQFSFSIKWWYNVNERAVVSGRSGYEYFSENDNYLYVIAQFFPRMCVYNDIDGWQNKQFLGRGEFTLAFGDYDVEVTVPDHFKVAATGVLQNPKSVLSRLEMKRFHQAQTSFEQPIMVVTPEDALLNEKKNSQKSKTWKFKAENVRDFAFAASNKFIWDAMAVKFKSGKTALAMSMYPKEGNPLWEQYSTKVVAHTLKWYSHYTIEYPYPVAWSIHTNNIGMEYPMICFNGARPEADGTYSKRTKYGLIGVITHEVGHNFFPMIINSDERQWTWMDEGLNTFVQQLTHEQWQKDYPGRYTTPESMIAYMGGDKKNIRPIMTNSESIYQFGYNAYGKPTAALNILRETVMGRTLFDYAFKTYCERWAFKHPSPADLFRTMEDASSIDLDWFWRGWFYTTDFVDIGIKYVKAYSLNDKEPKSDLQYLQKERDNQPVFIGRTRNNADPRAKYQDSDPHLKDFYTSYDPLTSRILSPEGYKRYYQSLSEEEQDFLNKKYLFYEISFENIGGLVMPIIISLEYMDGTSEEFRMPAEIWVKNNYTVTKVFKTRKQVKQVILDPNLETADVNKINNYFPPKIQKDRYELFKAKSHAKRKNPMQLSK